jgi:hypothetical protein
MAIVCYSCLGKESLSRANMPTWSLLTLVRSSHCRIAIPSHVPSTWLLQTAFAFVARSFKWFIYFVAVLGNVDCAWLANFCSPIPPPEHSFSTPSTQPNPKGRAEPSLLLRRTFTAIDGSDTPCLSSRKVLANGRSDQFSVVPFYGLASLEVFNRL